MKSSYTTVAFALLLLAFGLITAGLTLIWPPLGLISAGGFVWLLAYAYNEASKESKKP